MRIGVMGAGSVGCYLGGWLAAAGHQVVLIGRPWLRELIAASGLTLSRFEEEGASLRLGPNLEFSDEPSTLASCDVVLVTVKSRDTAAAGAALAVHIPAGVLVVSFQNGLSNADVLRGLPFNVVRIPPTRFHQGTSGVLAIGASPLSAPFSAALCGAGLPCEVHADMPGVLWTKLLFNLNNSVNALSGLPLKEQLSDIRFRRLTAGIILEGLAVLRAAGIAPRRVGRMMPRLAPRVLPLPNWLFFRVAATMIQIDPKARSSMWDDLQRGRPTEIDELNGALIALAATVDVPVPINEHLVRLIRRAEAAASGSPGLSPEALWPR
jgi:2-dehydropantoate 2-reductase